MTQRDPVCGMEIEPQSAFAKREHMGQTFYFCSQSCVDQFDVDPHRYVMTSATTGFNPQATLTRIELPVSGMPLKEHSTHLESTLRAVNGVEEVKVNATANRLEVQYDAQRKFSIPILTFVTPTSKPKDLTAPTIRATSTFWAS